MCKSKGGESECFITDGDIGQGCVISSWLVDVCMDVVLKEMKMRMGKMGVVFSEKRGKGRLPGSLYADHRKRI